MASLLRSHTNVSMRPTRDKVTNPTDLDELFDSYVETDQLCNLNDPTVELPSSDDLAHLFQLPSNGNHLFETSTTPNWDATEDAWRKALRNIDQNPASPTSFPDAFSVYPASRGKASLSDPELLNFDDLFELDQAEPRSSFSTPSSPKPHTPKSNRKAVSSFEHSIRDGISKLRKKPTLPSKMMRPSQYRAGLQDLWTHKMEGPSDTFNITLPSHTIPQTPPPTSKNIQDESPNGFFPRHQPYTISMAPYASDQNTADMSSSNYQLTPLSSPAIDTSSRNDGNAFPFSNDSMATAYISHQMSNAALSALQTPPSSHRFSAPAWGPETPASLDFSFSASADFASPGTRDDQVWWGDGNSHTAATASQPSATYQPTSRSSSQSLGYTTASVAGLGITCDSAPFSSFESSIGRDNGHANGFASSYDMNYASMLPQQSSLIPISQPSHTSSPPSRSPSISPSLQPQLRFSRRRQSSNTTRAATTQRRKSSANSGSSVGVGFVNFTPDDSRKILTGVAPSGSSKTKARREKEAAEKRRKLSQAAVKAVIEAGGDLGRLEKEGLLCLGGVE